MRPRPRARSSASTRSRSSSCPRFRVAATGRPGPRTGRRRGTARRGPASAPAAPCPARSSFAAARRGGGALLRRGAPARAPRSPSRTACSGSPGVLIQRERGDGEGIGGGLQVERRPDAARVRTVRRCSRRLEASSGRKSSSRAAIAKYGSSGFCAWTAIRCSTRRSAGISVRARRCWRASVARPRARRAAPAHLRVGVPYDRMLSCQRAYTIDRMLSMARARSMSVRDRRGRPRAMRSPVSPILVFRVSGALRSAAGDALARPAGQSSARWQVLAGAESGSMTVADIARMLGLQRQSIQRVADLLEAEGLVRSVENPRHRRAMLLALTESGAETLRADQEAQRVWPMGWARSSGGRASSARPRDAGARAGRPRGHAEALVAARWRRAIVRGEMRVDKPSVGVRADGSTFASPFPPIGDYGFLVRRRGHRARRARAAPSTGCACRASTRRASSARSSAGDAGALPGRAGRRHACPAARRYLPGTMILETSWGTADRLDHRPRRAADRAVAPRRRPLADLPPHARPTTTPSTSCCARSAACPARCRRSWTASRCSTTAARRAAGSTPATATTRAMRRAPTAPTSTLTLTTDMRLGFEGGAGQRPHAAQGGRRPLRRAVVGRRRAARRRTTTPTSGWSGRRTTGSTGWPAASSRTTRGAATCSAAR